MMRRWMSGSLVLAIASVISGSQASAELIVTGSDAFGRAASASFENNGGDLVVTLTNTSTADVMTPTDILTALFFNLASSPPLTPGSAVLGPGVAVVHAPTGAGGATDPGGGVGGEWAFRSGISASTPGGGDYGISAVGLGLFSKFDRFRGTSLDAPEALNGLNYGITSAGDDLTTGNNIVSAEDPLVPLIQNSVVFTLGGLPTELVLSSDHVTGVTFLYGTDIHGATLVPEPSPLMAWSSIGLMLAGYGYRRRRGA